jgi:hypothetical protein
VDLVDAFLAADGVIAALALDDVIAAAAEDHVVVRGPDDVACADDRGGLAVTEPQRQVGDLDRVEVESAQVGCGPGRRDDRRCRDDREGADQLLAEHDASPFLGVVALSAGMTRGRAGRLATCCVASGQGWALKKSQYSGATSKPAGLLRSFG